MKLTSEQTKDLTSLLSMTWRKRNGETDTSMVEHCLQSGKYIQIDNMFVDVCSRKPSITTTLWYDDTREGPEANFQNFKNENERFNMPSLLELEGQGIKELYFIVQYCGDHTGGRLVSLTYVDGDDSRLTPIRKVTPAELEQINQAIEEVRQDYAKRLVSYFKKYGKEHVTSQGYWADR